VKFDISELSVQSARGKFLRVFHDADNNVWHVFTTTDDLASHIDDLAKPGRTFGGGVTWTDGWHSVSDDAADFIVYGHAAGPIPIGGTYFPQAAMGPRGGGPSEYYTPGDIKGIIGNLAGNQPVGCVFLAGCHTNTFANALSDTLAPSTTVFGTDSTVNIAYNGLFPTIK
jgi:hypothetical protein